MTTTAPPSTIRYIFRCRAQHAWVRDYDNTPLLNDEGQPVGQPIPHRVVEGKRLYPGSIEERGCPECGGYADYLRPVKATASDTPCGQSCKEATGSECRCSCLSLNHGIVWLAR